MLTNLKKVALTLLVTISALCSYAQLQVTAQTNALLLAQRLAGDGISISNATITGSPLASGFFKNISGNQINLDSGIVFSSGRVLTAGTLYGVDGPATNFASTGHGLPGDAQLAAAINRPLTDLNDAIVLEFDFVPIGDTVKFNYVFGSEEYPSFTCSSFNDAFAFFISGPGITGAKNLALVPGTNVPVSINTINSGNFNDGSGQCGGFTPYPQYFINNSAGASYTHDGHTVVLTAQSVVVPCQTYHLKLVLADVADGAYDSGVFLKAKSLTSSSLQLINGNPVANGMPYVIEGCTNGSIIISRQKKFPFPQPVNLAFTGTAINGIDVQIIPSSVIIPAGDSILTVPFIPIPDNIVEGIEFLKVYITFGSCGTASAFYADSLTINIRDQLTGTAAVVPSNCSNNSGSITLTVPAGNGTAPFQYSINGGNFQNSNVFSGLSQGTNIVTIRDSSGCVHNIVSSVPLANNLVVDARPSDTSVCVGATFTPRIISAATSYSWTPTTGLSSSTIAQPVITVGNSNVQYIVTAQLGACVAKDTINVTTLLPPVISAGPDLIIINGDQIQLLATAGAGTYLWTPSTGLSATNILKPFAAPTVTTTYTLKATSTQGCVSTDDVKVTVLNCVDPMNAFSPNGDGINDVWMVNLGACFKTAVVEVFNRYGNQVFKDNAYANNWNGTYKGKPLPDGTYYYIVTINLINGKKTYVKGNVTILR